MNRNVTCFKLITCAAVLLFAACGKPAAPPAESSATAAETAVESSAVSETSAAAEVSSAAPVSSGITDQELEAAVESQYLSDEDFIANVRCGLEQRWSQVASQDGSSLGTKDFREYASEAVQAELDGIGELMYYSFKDENLPGLASSYYSALQDQLQGIREAESQEALSQSEVYMRGF